MQLPKQAVLLRIFTGENERSERPDVSPVTAIVILGCVARRRVPNLYS